MSSTHLPDGESDMVETDQEDGTENGGKEVHNIQLAFNTGKGGGWDDTELIKAYDAAMDEFHAHHPGPGSWLDKATAALKLGQPLPGTRDTSSAWYSASKPAPSSSASIMKLTEGKTYGPDVPSYKRKATQAPTANPYAPLPRPSKQQKSAQRVPTPTYDPPSPGAAEAGASGYDGDQYGAEEDEVGHGDGGEWYDESYALSHGPSAGEASASIPSQTPSFGVQETSTTSISDAFSYAMTAQYWAGYWMGVAQAKVQQGTPTPLSLPSTSSSGRNGKPNGATNDQDNDTSDLSNVIVTRKHFERPNRLKR